MLQLGLMWRGAALVCTLPDGKRCSLKTICHRFSPAMIVMVCVTNAVCRTRIRILVKDIKKAKNEFGPYVEPVRGDASNASALREALRGVRAIVVTGAVGDCIEAAAARQIDHVVLASCTGGLSSL